MLTHLFYLTGLLFVWKEIKWIIAPFEQVEHKKELDRLLKLNKGKKWDAYTKEDKDLIKSSWDSIIIFLWMFIGIFTIQWVLFLIMLIFNILIIDPLSKLLKYSIGYLILHWLNSIIGLSFGLFVIINHYHLHIDVLKYVNQLIHY